MTDPRNFKTATEQAIEAERVERGGLDALPAEIRERPEVFRRLTIAVREADQAFQTAGDAGTRTWLEDYFWPELRRWGLTVNEVGPITADAAKEATDE